MMPNPCCPLARVLAALLLAACAWPAFALDLQGHRGLRGLLPENSLPGFERAIALGVSTLELDAAVTQDGVVVIHHDLAPNPAYTRDAQGRWLDTPGAPIHARTWAELQALDIGRLRPGTSYAAQFPEQQPLDGTRIPRLAALFERVQALRADRLRFAIEIKVNPLRPDDTLAPEPFAQKLLDEIRAHGMLGRVQILSFDWRALAAVQRLAPGVPTVYLSAQQPWLDNIGAAAGGATAWTNGIAFRAHGSVPRMVKAAGGAVWSVYHGDLTQPLLREAQALGLKVLAWTVNDAPTMARLLDWGVDGLVTDRADIALKVMAGKGIRAD